MAEYIEREALLAELAKGTIISSDLYGMGIMAGADFAMKKIAEAPAADVVEVVRCEECLYRSQYTNKDGFYQCGAIQCKDGCCALVPPLFACIAGERRSDA